MSKKQTVVIIPARMGSSRFPGKPLKNILNLPMIEHVRRRALLCEVVDEVYVATCDREIADVVAKHNGKAIMTSDKHERCTDRVQEAVGKIAADIIVNLQGDEPLFFPEVINRLVSPMLKDDKIGCTNLLSVITDENDLRDKDIVKAVLGHGNQVLYFSRAPIPCLRVRGRCPMYRQTGISAFTRSFLNTFANLSSTPLETTESIDFLRILEHGFPIQGIIYDQKTTGVDQPDDIHIVEQILQKETAQNRLYRKILIV